MFLLAVAGSSLFAQSDRLARSINLTASERKALNASLPLRVRKFLETADEFVLFAQLEVQNGKLEPAMDTTLAPNFKAVVAGTDQRLNVLRALYSEASKDHGPAICYLPSHSIVARKGQQTVTVEICFGCRRFYITGALGESKGTFPHDGGETERLVTKLITDLGVTTK